jgi:ribosomal protein L18
MSASKEQIRLRRKLSIRHRVSGTEERPRLTVFRSSKHIYAQVIDDTQVDLARRLLVAHQGDLQGECAEKTKREMAELVGASDRQGLPGPRHHQGRLRPQRLHLPRPGPGPR